MKEYGEVESSVSASVEDNAENAFVYDPYELSRPRCEPRSGTSGQPRQKFNTTLFVIISAVVCILMCRSCDRYLTHPSEFVLGSPPGAFVDEGRLERENARVTHDVNLFYKCLDGILEMNNPEKQVERFVNNKYGVLKENDQKCVELLKIFVEAGEEYRRLFSDYAVAWTNSGALAIYWDNWDSEHDKREWPDLIKDAEAAQTSLVTGLHEFEKRSLAKIEKIIGAHKDDKAWLERMHKAFMNGMSSRVFPVKQLLAIRSKEVDTLISLAELYQANHDKMEEKDGRMIFTDEGLSAVEKKAWAILDKEEKDIAELFANIAERQNQ